MMFNWFKKIPNTDPFIWKLELKDGTKLKYVYDDLHNFYRTIGDTKLYKTWEAYKESLPSQIRRHEICLETRVKNGWED